MTDRVFLKLATGWAIGYDPHQWIVLRAKKRRDQPYWNPEAFVGSTRTVLLRVLREKRATVDPEAMDEIASWPERFLDWRAAVEAGTLHPSTDDTTNAEAVNARDAA